VIFKRFYFEIIFPRVFALRDLYPSPNIIWVIKQKERDDQVLWHVWEEVMCMQGFGGRNWAKETTWKP